ncbi:cobalamin-binding protein [Pseudothermotoga thermarum]|uniref:Cobalamin B12-binding domain protein n=1 Tax=Pseudothermotoga thermarum DSM 5069 TaxID=688269 RepID=F7YTY2_9THEM|nr:cobalamin-binding protein [Pseudothermotoga thermarum]AEH51564.1 cobalamin B12-binding domain protein [Pseudothermotoga thermarum DSM 5069]
MSNKIKYGFVKPYNDAHTLGLTTVAELLKDCGYDVLIADEKVSKAITDYKDERQRKVVTEWIRQNGVTRVGFSYRLDPIDAFNMVSYIILQMKKERMFKFQGGQVELVFFGGLPKACELIEKEFEGLVITFKGAESASETLLKMGVPPSKISKDIVEAAKYDEMLLQFGKEVIDSQEYLKYPPPNRATYEEFGTKKDTVVKRLDANMKDNFEPLIRAHVGPYRAELKREEAVQEFISWCKILAKSNYLDILSIGTSQLTQSNFGEDWTGLPNGGGVPINSPEEFRMVWEASRPMLVRTYAGTKNILWLAKMYEETINICWHALSLWWFNKLDGRGPYDLYTNLKEHIETIKYIATTNKPFEANVPHHFAFRGADDVTYIVSAYLSAKLAKKLGIKTFILQNMLNTPRSTWGVQDLAKSRAMLKLVRTLEDENFRVILQPRAGLDYFKPDLYEAKIQLAAVTALMDDIEPYNESSPPIIHVVSYSEAVHLATPDVIIESIQITHHALQKYRELKRKGKVDDMGKNEDVKQRMEELYNDAVKLINAVEEIIPDLYTPEGFYKVFAAGFLPVPYLWLEVEEFKHAKNWKTKFVKGGVKVVDDEGKPMPIEKRIEIAKSHLPDAEYNLKNLSL